jgi:hypothetical protein
MEELDVDLSEDTVSYDLENVLDGFDKRWFFITFYYFFIFSLIKCSSWEPYNEVPNRSTMKPETVKISLELK